MGMAQTQLQNDCEKYGKNKECTLTVGLSIP